MPEAVERDRDTGLASFLRGCPDPLSQVYDVALLDLDGVVYLGDAAVPSAPQALAKAADAGMRLAYVTNNSSRTPSAIAAQIASFGVPATAADVVTSAQAAATLLAGRLDPGSAVLVVGGTGLRAAIRERGFRPVTTALDRPAAVAQGFAPGIGYSLLCEGALAVQDGAWFVASNGDATMPTGRGRQPGNGALSQVIVYATGKQPVVAGKPEPPLHAEAVARTGAREPPAWSGTGWTPTSRARCGPGRPACWCSPASPAGRMRCWPARGSAPPTWRPTWPASSPRTLPSPPGRAPSAAAGG